MPVSVSGDYGADHAAIGKNHLTALYDADVYVSIMELKNPISMELAASDDGNTFTITSKQKARISTTLQLPEGPFNLRNVEYLVFDEHMPDVLLSLPLLQTLGLTLRLILHAFVQSTMALISPM